MTWHGYPQHPDAHEDRPWWRRAGVMGAWSRTDSSFLGPGLLTHYGEDGCPLAAYDAAHPLPAPEPRCGQVWADTKSGWQGTVVGVSKKKGYFCDLLQGLLSPPVWPPPGAVLVAGPGAPWAPMRE